MCVRFFCCFVRVCVLCGVCEWRIMCVCVCGVCEWRIMCVVCVCVCVCGVCEGEGVCQRLENLVGP